MRIDLGEDEQPEIGLIALIDCIFFLLMFFMVATSFKHQADGPQARGLPIQLPQAAVSLDRQQALGSAVVIGVDIKGGLYWGNEPVDAPQLRALLHEQAQRDRGVLVRIDGDAKAPYQAVIHLVDLCQFEGLTNIALRTRRGG
jgi:biopolymer transport protein ExbD